MDDGFLGRGPIVPDIVGFQPSPEISSSASGIIGGFPCQVGFRLAKTIRLVSHLLRQSSFDAFCDLLTHSLDTSDLRLKSH